MKKFFRFGIAYRGREYISTGTQTTPSGSRYNDNVYMGTTWNMMPGDGFELIFYNFMGQYTEVHNNPSLLYNEDSVFGAFWDQKDVSAAPRQDSGGMNRWLIQCLADENGDPYLGIRARGYNDDTGDIRLGFVINDYPDWRINYFKSISQRLTEDPNHPLHSLDLDIPYGQFTGGAGIIKRKPITISSSQYTATSAWTYGNPPFFYSNLFYRQDSQEPKYSSLIFENIETQLSKNITARISNGGGLNPSNHRWLKGNGKAPWAGPLVINAAGTGECTNILSLVLAQGIGHGYENMFCANGNTGDFNLSGWVYPRKKLSFGQEVAFTNKANAFRPFGVYTNGDTNYMSNVLFNFGSSNISNAIAGTNMNDAQATFTDYLPTFAIGEDENAMTKLYRCIAAFYGECASSSNTVFPYYIQNTNTQCGYTNGTPLIDRFHACYIPCSRNLQTGEGTWGILCQSMSCPDNLNTIDYASPNNVLDCLIIPSLTSDWPALDIYGLYPHRAYAPTHREKYKFTWRPNLMACGLGYDNPGFTNWMAFSNWVYIYSSCDKDNGNVNWNYVA